MKRAELSLTSIGVAIITLIAVAVIIAIATSKLSLFDQGLDDIRNRDCSGTIGGVQYEMYASGQCPEGFEKVIGYFEGSDEGGACCKEKSCGHTCAATGECGDNTGEEKVSGYCKEDGQVCCKGFITT